MQKIFRKIDFVMKCKLFQTLWKIHTFYEKSVSIGGKEREKK